MAPRPESVAGALDDPAVVIDDGGLHNFVPALPAGYSSRIAFKPLQSLDKPYTYKTAL